MILLILIFGRSRTNRKTILRSRIDRIRYRSSLGIYCLTEDPDNHVMWVNYAKQHKGFVIGFNLSDPFWPENRAVPSKVEYVSAPPKLASDDKPSVELSLLKSVAWSYEKEWRAVRSFDTKESRDVPYSPELISEIIIGSEMEHYHTARLLDVVDALSSSSRVELFDSLPDREHWEFKHVRSTKEVCTKCSGHGYTIR